MLAFVASSVNREATTTLEVDATVTLLTNRAKPQMASGVWLWARPFPPPFWRVRWERTLFRHVPPTRHFARYAKPLVLFRGGLTLARHPDTVGTLLRHWRRNDMTTLPVSHCDV